MPCLLDSGGYRTKPATRAQPQTPTPCGSLGSPLTNNSSPNSHTRQSGTSLTYPSPVFSSPIYPSPMYPPPPADEAPRGRPNIKHQPRVLSSETVKSSEAATRARRQKGTSPGLDCRIYRDMSDISGYLTEVLNPNLPHQAERHFPDISFPGRRLTKHRAGVPTSNTESVASSEAATLANSNKFLLAGRAALPRHILSRAPADQALCGGPNIKH